MIDVGFWKDFQVSPERLRQIEANEVSYTWDRLIEKFSRHIRDGTSYSNSHPGFADQIVPMRWMARSRAFRRRMLSAILVEFIEKTYVERKLLRFTRVAKPSYPGDPYYIFLLLSQPPEKPYEDYRTVRWKLLESLCLVAKLLFPDAEDFVGIATEERA